MTTEDATVAPAEPARPTTAPLGIKLICIVNAIITPFALVLLLRLVAEGGTIAMLSGVLIVLCVAWVVVLIGLWTLESWSWTLSLVGYGLSSVGAFATGDVLSAIVGVVILLYIASRVDYYR